MAEENERTTSELFSEKDHESETELEDAVGITFGKRSDPSFRTNRLSKQEKLFYSRRTRLCLMTGKLQKFS